jgi:uncharacterized protein
LKQALIIFARNPVRGKVKTRLAATLGDDKALSIYQSLLEHTVQITQQMPCDRYVFYADGISLKDVWPDDLYLKKNQEGNDLGQRMLHAFDTLFQQEYQKIIIIGTDCFELSYSILLDAFTALDEKEVVIGPSKDGGYYLLGMRHFFPFLFEEKTWSTDTVYSSTVQQLAIQNIRYDTLPILNDIDTEGDWKQYLHQQS